MLQQMTPAGHLKIQLEGGADKEMVEELLERCGGNDVLLLAELLEQTGWQPNGHLFQVRPEQVGALTDAPMLSDELGLADDGSPENVGIVWWYPAYELKNFGQELLTKGFVVFEREPQVH